ncbi:hypothetical protein C0Z11_12250 [Acidipropionibacterium jensenii]|nr:hypothetical protein C0Z11_12250 [Acidipropionibacterium jensenii]
MICAAGRPPPRPVILINSIPLLAAQPSSKIQIIATTNGELFRIARDALDEPITVRDDHDPARSDNTLRGSSPALDAATYRREHSHLRRHRFARWWIDHRAPAARTIDPHILFE